MKSFSWKTPEYAHKEKSQDWYWTVGIITAALVVTSIIFGDALFAAVIALGAFALTLFASRKPRVVSVDVTEKGIVIDKVLYPYPTLDSFFLDEAHHHGPRLILKSKKVVMPLMSVPVRHESLDDLHTFLLGRMKEEAFEDSFFQLLLERFGF